MGYDPRTGNMEPIPPGVIDQLRATIPTTTPQEQEQRMLEELGKRGWENLTMLLHEGEEIEIKGARFRVVSIGRRFIGLEGLPAK